MKIKFKKLLVPLVTVVLLLAFTMGAAAAPAVPDKPGQFDYVQDFAGILSPEDKARISSLGREIDEKTKAQIVVVTVDTLGDTPIEMYANQLFRSWGIGDKEKNNGILLLVNKENMLSGKSGRVRLEVGYGLEGAVPDGKAGRILDDYVLSYWGQQKYSQGITQGFMATANEVANEYNIKLDGSYAPVPLKSKGEEVGAPYVGLIMALIIFGVITSLNKRNRKGRNRRDDDIFPGGFFGGGGGFGGGFGGGGGGFGGGFGGGSSGGGGASR